MITPEAERGLIPKSHPQEVIGDLFDQLQENEGTKLTLLGFEPVV